MTKRYKRTSFWICAFFAVMGTADSLLHIFGKNYDEMMAGFKGICLALAFAVAAFLLYRRNSKADAARAAWEAQQQEMQRSTWEKQQAEEQERRMQQAAWEAQHGQIFTKIAGVTFQNEDGSSRQRALQGAMADEGAGSVALELYDYNGKDAIRVEYEGVCVGNIPQARVAEVAGVLDRITAAHLDVSRFVPDDEDDEVRGLGGVIYRADLTLVFKKL